MTLSWMDRLEIQDVMTRYAAAMDIGSTEAEMLSLFTDDATLTSPLLPAPIVGTEGLRTFWTRIEAMRAETIMRHYLTNVRVIAEDETSATLKAYFVETITSRKPRVPSLPRVTEVLFSGLYDCGFVKSAGAWRIQRRTVFLDAHSPLTAETAAMFGA